jgi:hypothetical protein
MDKENLTPPIAQENKQNSSEEKSGSATGKVIAAIIICILLFSAVYGLGGGCEPIVVDVPVKVEGEIKIVPIEEN